MTTLIAPIRNISYALSEPLVLMDKARRSLLSDDVSFYLKGESIQAQFLAGLRLFFTLQDGGDTLIFMEADDVTYFAQFERIFWIKKAVQLLLSGSRQGLDVYIEGQISGMPKAILMTQTRMMRDYLGRGAANDGVIPAQMMSGYHGRQLAQQQAM